jgi:hypothetical protein
MGNRSRWASGTLADRLPNVMALKHCLAKRLSEPFWALRQLLGSLSFNASRRHYLEEKENQEENNQAAPMRRPGRATAWEENERRRISIQGLQQQRRPSLDHLFIVSVRAYYAPSGARPSGLSSSILTALDLGTWGISNAATLPKAEHPSSARNAAIAAASRSIRQAPMRRGTAAPGGRWVQRTNATLPGGGNDTRDHTSARAGVRAAATPAREALAPCDILNHLSPGGD